MTPARFAAWTVAFAPVLSVLMFAAAPAAGAATVWEAQHQPRLERVGSAEAQLDGPVRAMTSDPDGRMWLAAGADLWRWDSRQLTRAVLPGDADDTPEQAPAIQTVASDAAGGLWAGGVGGLYRLDNGDPGRPRLVPVPIPGAPPSVSLLAFPALAADDATGLAGTVGEVLVVGAAGVQARIPIPDAGPNRLHALHVDRQGRRWVGTSFGLYELRWRADGGPQWRAQPLAGPRQRVAAIAETADGRLFIGTAIDGLQEIVGDRARRHAWPAGETPSRVYAMAAAGASSLWVGTFGSGVWIYDPSSGQWRVLRHDRTRPDSLQDDNIWSLHRDARGLLWIGHGVGAQYVDPAQRLLLHVPVRVEDAASRLRVHSIALADGRGDALWLGLGSGRVRALGTPAAGVELDRRWGRGDASAGAVELLAPTGDGRWFLGSDWLTRWAEPGTGPLRDLQPPPRGTASYTSAAVAWQGAWWLAGPDGLWRVPLDAAGAPRLAEARNVLGTTSGERRVASLLVHDDALWVGTWSGLQRLDAALDAAPEPIEVPGLAGHFVSALALDGRGRLWLATSEGGLFHAREAEARTPSAWGRLGVTEGLPTRGVAALVVDGEGRLWGSGTRGLFTVDPDTRALRVFRPEDGAAAAPYLRRSALRLPDGTLAFGGSDAITFVRPGAAVPTAPTASPPRLVLSGLRGDREFPARVDDAPEAGVGAWRFGADTSRIEIDVVAPVFLGADRVRYRHRLVGVDDRWIEGGVGHSSVAYSRVPPGRFRFDAEYALDGGPWTGRLSLDLVRVPAWHEEPLFRWGLVAVGALVLVVGWRLRSSVLRTRSAALERMVEARTAALAAANAELAQAHRAVEEASLTDPLTGLHNRRFLWRHIDADVALALRGRFGGESAPREPSDLLFFLVDVDHFKRINDQHGHAVGDRVLIEMGQRLRGVFRESDHVVRWGGEEFLGVARGAHREDGPRVAERIRAAIAGAPFVFAGGYTLSVQCSVGFAALPLVGAHRHAFGWEDTVAIADEALYEAKAAGRDGWAGFEESGGPIGPQDLAALRSRSIKAIAVPGLALRRSRD